MEELWINLLELFFRTLALDVVDSGEQIQFFNGWSARDWLFKTFDDINIFGHASFSKFQLLLNFWHNA